MTSRVALATLAVSTALMAVPAFAQTSNNQQYNYPLGRSVNDAGPNYSGTQANPSGDQRTGTAEQRQQTATRRIIRQPRGVAGRGDEYAAGDYRYNDARYYNGGDRDYYNYAGGPGMAAPDANTVAWCQARFRSFDPATGTFMGFDGMRHPCP